MMEFHIFLECAWKASVIPLGDDTAFFAMKDFGNYDMKMPALLAITGATAGQIFNWLIGKFLISFKDNFRLSEYRYGRIVTLFNKYGIFLLLFCWAPLCNLLVVLAGFVGTKPGIALTLVLAGEIFNYGQYLI